MVAVAFCVFGYREEAWTYAWLPRLSPVAGPMTVVFSLTGCVAIIGISAWPDARRFLGGGSGLLLGSLSFPIYLVHVPIQMSGACAAFVALYGSSGAHTASAALVGVTLTGTAAVAFVLSRIDARRVRVLNWSVDRVTRLLTIRPLRRSAGTESLSP